MAVSVSKIIALVVSLLLMGILLPIGLNDILGFTSTNSTIQTLVATVVPIMAVLSLVLALVPSSK
ncbi:MAG: hypothetical protein ACP6IY_19320 [Promethearchaeia archaeon]